MNAYLIEWRLLVQIPTMKIRKDFECRLFRKIREYGLLIRIWNEPETLEKVAARNGDPEEDIITIDHIFVSIETPGRYMTRTNKPLMSKEYFEHLLQTGKVGYWIFDYTNLLGEGEVSDDIYIPPMMKSEIKKLEYDADPKLVFRGIPGKDWKELNGGREKMLWQLGNIIIRTKNEFG